MKSCFSFGTQLFQVKKYKFSLQLLKKCVELQLDSCDYDRTAKRLLMMATCAKFEEGPEVIYLCKCTLSE